MSSVVAVRHRLPHHDSHQGKGLTGWMPLALCADASTGWKIAKLLAADPTTTAVDVCNVSLSDDRERPYTGIWAVNP
jgi:hypothetical protein